MIEKSLPVSIPVTVDFVQVIGSSPEKNEHVDAWNISSH